MGKWRDRFRRTRRREAESRQESDIDDEDDFFTPSPDKVGKQNPIALKPMDQGQAVDDTTVDIDDVDLLFSPFGKFNKRSNEESLRKLRSALDQYARDGDAENIDRILGARRDLVDYIFETKDPSHPSDSTLHVAAKYGQLECVKGIVEMLEGVYQLDIRHLISSEGESGATPLHHAISGRKQVPIETKTKIVEYLVSKGADVRKKDGDGQSPLHCAVSWGNWESTIILIEKDKGIVEETDKNGLTALQMACSLNRNRIAKIIIDNMPSPSDDDTDGQPDPTVIKGKQASSSPLHIACMKGNLEMVNILIGSAEKDTETGRASQMVNAKDADGQTPLHVALGNRHFAVAKRCILKGADVNIPGIGKNTALHLAAVAGDRSAVKLLLDKGASIDETNDHQATALHLAALLDNQDICAMLVNRKANLEVRNKPDSWTPLLVAAGSGHQKTVKALLKRGADYTATDRYERNAVHLGAEIDAPAVIEAILGRVQGDEAEEDELIDCQNIEGNAPLHSAAERGNLEAVQCLIRHKADMCMKNDDHKTPLHLASQSGMKTVVRELVIALPSMVNMEDKQGNTALHLAALAGEDQVIRHLISKGKADIEARNSNFQTPLHLAATEGWIRTCRFLLHKDANINAQDDLGRTPLHVACQNGKEYVVSLLINRRTPAQMVNTDKKTNYGETCLDLAVQKNHTDAALALVMSSRWKEFLKHDHYDECREDEVPLKKLIIHMPDVAQAVLYQCTVKNEELSQDVVTYDFNFTYLDDRTYDESSSNQYHCLRLMMKHKRLDLLYHPIVIALLRQKWLQFGKAFYCTNLFIYALFLTVLTVYVLSVAPVAPHHYLNMTDYDLFDGSFCEKVRTDAAREGITITMPVLAKICKYMVMILCIEQVIRETFQRILSSGLMYFTRIVHWVEIIIYLTFQTATFLLVLDIQTPCQSDTGIRLEWQWQVGSVALFFGWIHLLLFIRKVPVFGIYAVMFASVFGSFLQFFPVFFLLIVAFALSFYCLLGNQIPFRNAGFSLYKTSVMMIGEMDYLDLFHRRHEQESSDSRDAQIWYGAMTYILFTLFLIIMAVLVMNLLTGLAVGDTTKVQEKSKSRTIKMQISYLLDTERLWIHFRKIWQTYVRKQPRKRRDSSPVSEDVVNFLLKRSTNVFMINWVLSTASIFNQCKSVNIWKREQEKIEKERRRLIEEKESIKDSKDSFKVMNKLERLVSDLDRKLDERVGDIEARLEKIAASLEVQGFGGP